MTDPKDHGKPMDGNFISSAPGRVLGNIEHFIPGSEPFENYLDRLEAFFAVNISSDKEKVNSLIVLIGPEMYKTLKNLLVPAKPTDKTFDQLILVLKGHYAPAELEVAERYKFNSRSQRPNESVRDFIMALKQLAISCNFGTFLDQALRDRLVVGLKEEAMIRRLLLEKSLTFEAACKLVQEIEAVQQQTQNIVYHSGSRQIHGVSANNPSRSIHGNQNCAFSPQVYKKNNFRPRSKSRPNSSCRINEKGSQLNSKGSNRPRCFKCDKQHVPNDICPAAKWVCFKCNKVGHVASVCRSAKVNFVEVECTNLGVNNVQCVLPLVSPLHVENEVIPFEVDSGATLTLMPHFMYCKFLRQVPLKPFDCSLSVANQQPLGTKGIIDANVNYFGKMFKLPLVVTENSLQKALLGRDWLTQLNPNWKNMLLSHNGGSKVSLEDKLGLVNECKTVESSNDQVGLHCNKSLGLDSCLRRMFPNIFSGSNNDPIKGFQADISLRDGSVPIFHKAYNVPYAVREDVVKELKFLEETKVVSKVKYSQWASPIVCVPKRNGKIRLCVDFKVTLNKFINVDCHPLPLPEDIFNEMLDSKIFCQIDLSNAYLQLEVSDQSKPLLTVNTICGLYQFNRLCFGLSSAPMIFQSVIESVLNGIPKVGVYLDDILIGGKDENDCRQTLFEVLSRLNSHNIKINVAKSNLFVKSLDYLGFTLDSEGLRPSVSKVEAIKNAPRPENVSQVKSYLGMLNYYHKFIPMSGDLLEPLYDLTRKSTNWKWSLECEEAFVKSKAILSEKSLLVLFNPKLPITVTCDSSSYGVGAVLSNTIDNVECPVAFVSSTLSKTQRNYSQVDREALAVMFALKKFNKFLLGNFFKLVTDNEALKSIFNPRKSIPQLSAARLQRWCITLSAYNYEICHKKGTSIYNADALSRLPLSSEVDIDVNNCNFVHIDKQPLMSHKEVSVATLKDDVLSKVVLYTREGWYRFRSKSKEVDVRLNFYFKNKSKLSIDHECLMYGNKVVIPDSLKSNVLKLIHNGHIGIVRSKLLARSYVWWLNMDADIEQFIVTCPVCQLTQNAHSPQVRVHWPNSVKCWQRVHIDFLEIEGKKILVLVDDYSKWVECWVMSLTNAKNVVDRLNECFSRFSYPGVLVSDNGPPFDSHEFNDYLSSHNIKLMHSPPYQPQSNGLAERSVQTVKKMLLRSLRANDASMDLFQRLNKCLYIYRYTPTTTTKCTPAQLMLNFKPRTELSMLNPSLKSSVKSEYRPKPCTNVQPIRKFNVNDKVIVNIFIRGKKEWKPACIMSKIGNVIYLVKLTNGIIRKVHVNQIKLSYLDDRLHPKPFDFTECVPYVSGGDKTDSTLGRSDIENSVSPKSPVREKIFHFSSPPLALRKPSRNIVPPKRYSP